MALFARWAILVDEYCKGLRYRSLESKNCSCLPPNLYRTKDGESVQEWRMQEVCSAPIQLLPDQFPSIISRGSAAQRPIKKRY